MSSSDSTVLVDDSNHRVQYRAGWKWDQGVLEVDGTRHEAPKSGLTASLAFVGTSIRVVGTLGESATYGQPRTTYTIDGVVQGSYDAPFVATGDTQYNVTFFTSPQLSSGDHTVTITTVEGSGSDTYLLDYFLVDNGSPPSSQPPNPTPVPATSPPDLPNTTTDNPSIVSPPTSSPQPHSLIENASSTSTSTSSTPSSSSPSVTTISSESVQVIASSSQASDTTSRVLSLFPLPLATLSALGTTQDSLSLQASSTSAAREAPTSLLPTSSSGHSTYSSVLVIVLAAVAGVCVFAGLGVLLFCLLRRRRRRMSGLAAAPFNGSQERLAPHTRPHSRFREPSDAPDNIPSPTSDASLHDDEVLHITPPETTSGSIIARHSQSEMEWASPALLSTSSHRHTTSRSTPSARAARRLTRVIVSESEKQSAPHSFPLNLSTAETGTTGAPRRSSLTDPPIPPYSSALFSPPRRAHATGSGRAEHTIPATPSRSQSLLRAILPGWVPRAGRAHGPARVVHDVDSGLRVDGDIVLPPPYTQH